MDKGYVQNTIFELLSRLGIGYEKLEHSPIITMKEGCLLYTSDAADD